MNVLFVSSELFNRTGGGTLARSYLQVLQGMDEIKVFPFAFPKRDTEEEKTFDGYLTKKHYSSFEKTINLLFRKDPLIGRDVEDELIDYIDEKSIDLVFLFRSTQGFLIKTIRNRYPDMPVVAFYHDIFPDVVETRKKDSFKGYVKKLPLLHAYSKSERYSVDNASASIVLNERERRSFVKYYHKDPNLVIPIIWKDFFDPTKVDFGQNEKLVMLFVGQYFPPNVNGLRWFARNVMPNLSDNVVLNVVGNRMERLKDDPDFNDSRINIIGSVDSLARYYYETDLVVAPIFEGTGMKTKTAEALMFGKVILASGEALTGYDYLSEALCEDASQFIERINGYSVKHPAKFDIRLRRLYEQNHSVENARRKLESLFGSFDTVKQSCHR